MLYNKFKKNICLYLTFFTVITFFNITYANEKDAINFVNDLANRAIEITKSQVLTDEVKSSKLTDIFLKAVDTKFIAKFALGKYWRTLSPEQQNQYLDLYSKYLVDMYVPNFKKYTGNVVKVLNAKELRENDFLVQTELGGGSSENNIQINYMLRKNPKGIESFVIFDIVAEGVSLITTQRDEINSVMVDNNGDFNGLMTILRKKIGHQPSSASSDSN